VTANKQMYFFVRRLWHHVWFKSYEVSPRGLSFKAQEA